MTNQIVYQIAEWTNQHGKTIRLRCLGPSEMWPGNVMVQKITAHGMHGIWSVKPDELKIVSEEAR